MFFKNKSAALLVALLMALLLGACKTYLGQAGEAAAASGGTGGSGGGGGTCTGSYTVGGSVTGLTGTLVLQNNGADDLTLTSNGSFSFATAVANCTVYEVTVKTNPAGQVCMVDNNAGVIADANVTNMAVRCATDTNWVQDAYLKASNAGAGDSFGYAVAISGSTIVVGAPYEDSSQTTISNDDSTASSDNTKDSSGAVYVFEKDTAGSKCTILTGESWCWYQDAYLKGSNSDSGTPFGDIFGHSVAISGSTIVVGAPYEDSNQTYVSNNDGFASIDNTSPESGAVYVFQRDNQGVWYQDAYLKPSNTGANDNFGNSVSIFGSMVAVAARYEDAMETTILNTDNYASSDDSASNSGAVYVFKRQSNGIWIQDAYLKASNNSSSDEFGFSIAIFDNTIVVGAPNEDSDQTTITNTNNLANSNNSFPEAGAVYVFQRDSMGNWYQDAYLKASNCRDNYLFGWSVAISGSTLVVGSPYEDSSQITITNLDDTAATDTAANVAGAAYVFKRDSNGDWIQDAFLKAKNAEANDQFGRSVSLSGSTILVGAFFEASNQNGVTNNNDMASGNNSAPQSGAVYIFQKNSSGDWYQDAYMKQSNTESYDYFGYSIALSGTIALVGAPYEDSNQTTITNADGTASTNNSASGAGAVYVFKAF